MTVSLQLVPGQGHDGQGQEGEDDDGNGARAHLQRRRSTAPGSLAAYHVFTGKTKKGVTTFSKPVPLASVVYNPGTLTAMLAPKNKLNLSQPEQLQVTAALLTDTFGRPLDGKHNGQPGSNFVATFSNKGGIQTQQVRGKSALATLSASAVDALFAE